MKFLLAVLVTLFSVALALPALKHEEYDFVFTKWAQQHGKTYATVHERTQRLAVFKANLDYIRKHQANTKNTWSLQMNQFGDLSNEEFVQRYNGYTPIKRSFLRSLNEVQDNVVPLDSIDWRAKGKVTEIKDQGQCGSCWAFSAIGSIESGYAVDNSKNADTEASEQQLVDCAGPEGNQGCSGGLMDQGFQYVIDNKGVCTEKAYPYTAQDGTCKTTCTKTLTISGFKDVTPNNATALMAAVSQRPVSIAVDASGSDWQFYSGGVLSDAGCGTSLDHGVLNVGYVDDGGQAYWIVKNSWGTSWGDAGYIYISNTKQNDEGICGINMDPSYPVGVKKIATKHHKLGRHH